MYQNLFDYMFAYSNYTASEGKIVSTYTTSDQKTTDKYTYSVDGDTLTLNNDTYSRISFSDLKWWITVDSMLKIFRIFLTS